MAANGTKRHRLATSAPAEEPFRLAALQPETLQLVFKQLPSSSQAAVNATCRQFSTVLRELVLAVELPMAQLAAGTRALAWQAASRRNARSDTQLSRQYMARERNAAGPAGPAEVAGAAGAAGAAACNGAAEVHMRDELLWRLGARHKNVCALTLHSNAAMPAKELAHQFDLLAAGALPGLTALELRDAQFWKLPWSFGRCLGQLSALSGLRELKLLMQAPGLQYAALGGSQDPAWQARFGQELLCLSALTSLETLQMRCIAGERGFFTSAAFLEMVPALTNLRSLDCGYVAISNGSLAHLSPLTRLTTLVLYGDFTALRLQELTALAPLSKLYRLELFHDGVMPPVDEAVAPVEQPSSEAVAQVLGAMTSMQCLSWLNIPICPATWSIVPMMKGMPTLKELYIQNIDMERQDFDEVAASLDAGTLTVLQLDNIMLSPVLLSALAPLTLLTQLVLFNMNPHPAGTADQLSALSRLGNLRQFCMDTLAVNEGTAVLSNMCLAFLAKCWTALESLHFSYELPPNSEPLTITALQHFTQLRDLSLAAVQPNTVRLDCSSLPARLHSLCLSQLGLQQVHSVPKTVQHVWLADCSPASGFLLCITETLLDLRTLVIKSSLPNAAYVLPPPVQASICNLRHLETLGLTSTYEDLQLSRLSSLTQLKKLVLDYSLDPGVVDAAGVLEQLQALTSLRRLRSLWLSDNVLGGGGDIMLWQHMLQQGTMPLLCIRPCSSDWYWKTSFPVGSCLDVDNPISSWYLWNSWNIL